MQARHEGEHRTRGRGALRRIFGIFRSRQVYVRSASDVLFISLSPMAQISALLMFLGVLFWTAYATVNFFFKDQLLLLREQRMTEARLDYEDRVAVMRVAIDKLNDKLLLDQKAYLDKVDDVDAEFRQLVLQHEELVRLIRDGLPRRPSDPDNDDAATGKSPDKSGFNTGSFSDIYAAEFRSPAEALQPLSDLRRRFASLEDLQVKLAEDAIARGSGEVERARAIIRRVGVADAADRPAAVVTANAGGPFIPVSTGDVATDRFSSRMMLAWQTLEEFDQVKRQIDRLPIYLPMKSVERISSGFGLRRDPFRRTLAMHSGVDFKASLASDVIAVSHGVVTFAGWSGAYGRMIEISHDNGVSTRYAHLSSIKVSPGASVKRGEVIGRMGSTGRSTGPHLHYETRVDGRAIDPVRFWQAFNDLQALKSKER